MNGRVASSTKLVPPVTGVSISNCVCVCLCVSVFHSVPSQWQRMHAFVAFLFRLPLPTSIRRSGCFSDFSTIRPIQPGFVLRSHSVAVCVCVRRRAATARFWGGAGGRGRLNNFPVRRNNKYFFTNRHRTTVRWHIPAFSEVPLAPCNKHQKTMPCVCLCFAGPVFIFQPRRNLMPPVRLPVRGVSKKLCKNNRDVM